MKNYLSITGHCEEVILYITLPVVIVDNMEQAEDVQKHIKKIRLYADYLEVSFNWEKYLLKDKDIEGVEIVHSGEIKGQSVNWSLADCFRDLEARCQEFSYLDAQGMKYHSFEYLAYGITNKVLL